MAKDWDNKHWYVVQGRLPNLKDGIVDESYMISWDYNQDLVQFYYLGNLKMSASEQLVDNFHHLDYDKDMQDGNYRTARTETMAFLGSDIHYVWDADSELIEKNTDTTFIFTDFLGTGYKVKAYDNGTGDYYYEVSKDIWV